MTITPEMLKAALVAESRVLSKSLSGHSSPEDRYEAIYLAMHSKAVGEDDVERLTLLQVAAYKKGWCDCDDDHFEDGHERLHFDSMNEGAAEFYGDARRAAISAMGDRRDD